MRTRVPVLLKKRYSKAQWSKDRDCYRDRVRDRENKKGQGTKTEPGRGRG